MKESRSLDGISYKVFQDPVEIKKFVNVTVRREWEKDIKRAGHDPEKSRWLGNLSSRRWRLTTLHSEQIKLNPEIMNIKNEKTGFNFLEDLLKRKVDLDRNMKKYKISFPPVVVREEDMNLIDGYCRFTTLRDLSIPRVYAYLGSEPSH
jgi:hypothetical protein